MVDVGTPSKAEIPTRPKTTKGYRMNRNNYKLDLTLHPTKKITQNSYKKLMAHPVKNSLNTFQISDIIQTIFPLHDTIKLEKSATKKLAKNISCLKIRLIILSNPLRLKGIIIKFIISPTK